MIGEMVTSGCGAELAESGSSHTSRRRRPALRMIGCHAAAHEKRGGEGDDQDGEDVLHAIGARQASLLIIRSIECQLGT